MGVVSGPCCRYCGHHCFVLRTLPDDARKPAAWPNQIHMATCKAGAEHDRSVTGYDHTTAPNPALAVTESGA